MEVEKESILGPLLGNFRSTIEKKQQSQVTAEVFSYNAGYTAFKKEQATAHTTTWMALTGKMLNKRSQTEKSTYRMNPVIQSRKLANLM